VSLELALVYGSDDGGVRMCGARFNGCERVVRTTGLTSLLPIASRTVPETSSTAPTATSSKGGKTVFVTEVVSLSSTR
jgi:hypothetical protein